MNAVRQQLLAGAGLAQQQHRRLHQRRAAGLALDLLRRRAGAHEARERVLGAPRLVQRAPRRRQFGLRARVVGKDRRQRLEFIEQREAHAADGAAGIVLDRQARDDHRLAVGFQQVQQDRLARGHHLPHQAVRNHLLAVEPDRVLRIGEAEARGIALVDPDHARVLVHHEGAFAEVFKGAEQRLHGAAGHVVVVEQQCATWVGDLVHTEESRLVSILRRAVSHNEDGTAARAVCAVSMERHCAPLIIFCDS